MFEKALISRIYKELPKLNNTRNRAKQLRKWTKDLNRHFSKEKIEMAKKYMKMSL